MSVYALGEQVPVIDSSAYVHPDATVIGAVTIGAGASIWPAAVLRGDYGRIEIGEFTSVQDGTVIHATPDWPTIVGARCVIGHNAHLEGCTVGDRCLIGSGSVVLNRAVIEPGGGVGAAALVSEGAVVPSGYIALGVPARVRPSKDLDDWVRHAADSYGAMALRYRNELRRIE